jgi:hypothetical protein
MTPVMELLAAPEEKEAEQLDPSWRAANGR